MGDATVILEAIQRGERQAAERLIPLVYQELRQLAASRLSHEPPGHTLQATELVHEAYLRLVATEAQGWEGRRHFFAAAAEAMRRILIDRARRKRSHRHGGGLRRMSVEAIELPAAMPDPLRGPRGRRGCRIQHSETVTSACGWWSGKQFIARSEFSRGWLRKSA
jgi:RNA polymerase sigma factor (TIGR02999 family)